MPQICIASTAGHWVHKTQDEDKKKTKQNNNTEN